jgi:two-component system sensor histidine kinase UhpB
MAQPIPQAASGAMDLPGLAFGSADGSFGLGLPQQLRDDCERQVRAEVARELHDRVAQPLSGRVTELELLKEHGDDRRRLRLRVDVAQDQVRAALFGLREVLCDLREQEWLDDGLVTRARGELEAVVLRHPHLDVRFRVSPRWPRTMRSRVADHLLQVMREAVHNARTHSGATRIEVGLGVCGRRAEVVVGDNGRGMQRPQRPGMGLLGIHERVTLLGGRLVVGDRPGGGTRVRVSVPREVLG